MPQFRDVAQHAGLTASIPNGGDASKQFIVETTGSGVALRELASIPVGVTLRERRAVISCGFDGNQFVLHVVQLYDSRANSIIFKV